MNDDVKKWLIKAMEDFNIVEHELKFQENEITTGPVCFHCQQFIEKLLKAFLVSKNIEFGKTHDLEYLLELCKTADMGFLKLDTGNLNFYAVEVRYPDEFYIPTLKEAKEGYNKIFI